MKKLVYMLYVANAMLISVLGDILWKYSQLTGSTYFWFGYVVAGVYLVSLFIIPKLQDEQMESFVRADLLSFLFIFYFFFVEIAYTEMGSWRKWLLLTILGLLFFKLSLWRAYTDGDFNNIWKRFTNFVNHYVEVHPFKVYIALLVVAVISFAVGYVLWVVGGEGDRPNVVLWGINPRPWGWTLFVPLVVALMYAMFSGIYLLAMRGSNTRFGFKLFQFDLLTYAFIPVFWILEITWRYIADWYLLFGIFFLLLLALKSVLLILYTYESLKVSLKKSLKLMFITAFVILLMTSLWHISAVPATGDGPYYLLIAHSLAYDRDFDLKNNFEEKDYKYFYWVKDLDKLPYVVKARGEEVIPHYSTLYPFILIPGYVIGGRLGAIVTNVLFGSMILVSLFIVSFMVTRSLFSSFLASWLVVLTSPIFFHVAQLFPEIVGASIVMWIVKDILLSFYRWCNHARARVRVIEVVLLLVLLSLVRDRFLAVAVILFLLFLFSTGDHKYKLITLLLLCGGTVAILFIAPYVAGGAAYWNYVEKTLNFVRVLGRLFSYSYCKVLEHNILGMVFDQELGLIIFSPFYIFSFAGIILMFKERRRALILFVLPVLWNVVVLTVVKGYNWFGGWSAPLRYMVCVAPLQGIPLAYAFKKLKGPLFNTLFVILAGWSIFVSIFMTFNPYYMYGKWNGTNNLLWLLKKYVHINFARFLPSSFVLHSFYRLSYMWVAVICVVLVAVYLLSKVSENRTKRCWTYPALSFGFIAVLVFAFWLVGVIPFREVMASAMFHRGGVQYDDKHRWRSLWVMQGNGEIYDYVVLPKGKGTLEITAAGLRTLNSLPVVTVRLNHKVVAVLNLECKRSGRWFERAYIVHYTVPLRGIYVLELIFKNLKLDRRKNKAVIAYVYNIRRK